MTEVLTESAVNTVTNEKEKETLSVKDFAERTKRTVSAPLFIMFAEYLGFVSKVIDWAEKWCNGEKPENYKVKIIETDAICLFHQAQKKYTDDELADWYNEFYDVILCNYDENLTKIMAQEAEYYDD